MLILEDVRNKCICIPKGFWPAVILICFVEEAAPLGEKLSLNEHTWKAETLFVIVVIILFMNVTMIFHEVVTATIHYKLLTSSFQYISYTNLSRRATMSMLSHVSPNIVSRDTL